MKNHGNFQAEILIKCYSEWQMHSIVRNREDCGDWPSYFDDSDTITKFPKEDIKF